MNKNLPHVIREVRAVLESGAADPAVAIAHVLDRARLLADPERAGMVLHRSPEGGWSRQPALEVRPRPVQPSPEPAPEPTPAPAPEAEAELTDLERQALAWDQSCQRARTVATTIKKQLDQHPAFQGIRADGDRILVALQVTSQQQWQQWRSWFGISPAAERPLDHAVCGDGRRDGVRVSVVAYDVPQVRARARASAERPVEIGGIVYDLARPQRDANGDTWYFHGDQRKDGMPLLSVDGRPERCSLANIIDLAGPLTAVTVEATPVTTGGAQ